MKFSSILFASLLEGLALAADDHPRRLKGGQHNHHRREKQLKHNDDGKPVRLLGLDDTRIVGGEQSDPGEFPYYVDLNICGGSLIAPDVVLTAAHCGSFQGSNVIVGAYRSGSTNNGAVRVSVSNEAKHPNYNDNTVENDFLLLKLSEPVTMNTNVVLSLNDQYATPADGEDLTVLGLGATSEGGSSPSILRDVVVQAIDTNECNQAYNGDVDDTSMFCAGVDGGGKDSCQGDSGGPIVKRIGDQHVQVGVVSWGEGCARETHPGVYARVSSASGWIKQVVCDNWQTEAPFCGGGGGGNPTSPPVTGSTPAPTPAPTPSSGGGSCPSGQMLFEFTIKTDDYGDEVSWVVKNSAGNRVVRGSGYENNQQYTKKKCIPADDCYKLILKDTYGDGLSAGGNNPGYILKIDGQVIEKEGGIDYGYKKRIDFGSCGGSGGGGGGSSCTQIALEVITDEYGYETEFFLLTDNGDLIWNAFGLSDNKKYTFNHCLDQSTCATLDVLDSYGDGILAPGKITLTVNGQVYYNGGDFGDGAVFRIGANC